MNLKQTIVATLFIFICGGLGAFALHKTWQANGTLATETPKPLTSGAIMRAKGVTLDKLRDEASQFGVSFLMTAEVDDYKYIRDRLFTNDKLASALRTAYDQGIMVYFTREFLRRAKRVHIDVEATDQEIIEFLLSKQT